MMSQWAYNSASAAISKTDAIETLVAANKQFIEALANVTKENEKLLSMLDHLIKETTKPKPQYPGKSNSYCWTHGFVIEQNINSKTWDNKSLGYKTEATKHNTMGDNLANKPSTK